MSRILVLDCGGSKTAIALLENGIVVARDEQGGANYFRDGPDTIARVLRQAIDRVAPVDAAVVAAAGIRGEAERTRVIDAARAVGVDVELAVYPDTRAALRSAGTRRGVVLVAGTGSAALAIGADGREARVGGWGSAIGDEGSGAWLGRRAVAALLRTHDEGRDLPVLRRAVLDRLGMTQVADLRDLSTASPATFASLAPVLGRLRAAGDPTAIGLVESAVDELVRLATLAAARVHLERPIDVALVGGLVSAIDDLPVLLQQRLGDAYEMRMPEEEPVMGAYRLAVEENRWDTSAARSLAVTETANPLSERIDQVSTIEMLHIINQEDAKVAPAIGEHLEEIARLVDATAARMGKGGRLIYLGAGTSGRLAMLDAAECVPTFGTRPEQVVALVAGGAEALTRAIEGAEDNGLAAVRAIEAIDVSSLDVVVGVSASGRAAFVRYGVAEARRRGAFTGFITCGGIVAAADVVISIPVGPEVLSGSTRMKAGTAQKLVLNMVSTGTMIRLGRTLGNRMVKMRPTNTKLRERAVGLVVSLSGTNETAALKALDACGWDVERAALLARLGSAEAVEAQLARHGGNARESLQALDGA